MHTQKQPYFSILLQIKTTFLSFLRSFTFRPASTDMLADTGSPSSSVFPIQAEDGHEERRLLSLMQTGIVADSHSENI